MNPELTKAIKERLSLGHTEEMIRAELIQAGYEASVIDQIISGTQAAIPGAAPEGGVLPTATELFWTGWYFAKRYYPLVIFLSIPMLLLEVATHVQKTNPTYSEISESIVAVASIVTLVVYFLIITTALRLAALDDGTTTHPLSSMWDWTKQHVFGLVWVLLLSALIIAGGFFLFIIPGIIVSFLLYLAQYVNAVEGKRGLEALLRSRELVQGHWLQLVGRLVILVLFFFLVMLGIGMVVGLLVILMGGTFFSGPTEEFAFNLLGQVVSVIATIMGVKIGMVLYQNFAAERPANPAAIIAAKGKYLALAWFGLICILMVVAASAATMKLPVREEANEGRVNFDAKQRALEMRTESDVAPAYESELPVTEEENQP